LPVKPQPGADRAVTVGTVTLGIDGLSLPQPVPGMGDKLDRIEISGALMEAIPARDTLLQSLVAWRDAGGTIEIASLHLVWGELDVTGNGTLALDAGMQPMGAFGTSIAGYGKVLDALAATGAIKPSQAPTMHMALDMLARAGDPERHRLKTPLTIQDGAIYAGPLKLANMPRIAW
jgi:hypothetical protein